MWVLRVAIPGELWSSLKEEAIDEVKGREQMGVIGAD